jgi:YebC/PmpR family DNA-binding regulatory protein
VIVFGRNYETNIKNKKGPAELKKAKITKKHLSLITNLCKEGGTDENINGRLARAIKAAIREGVPKDTCYRRIESFNSSKDAFIDLEIDGSGPQGVAVRVLATTDNTNRTRTDVREAFKEIGMDVGKDGTHSHIFRKEGILKFKDVEEDTIMEASMEAEAEDVVQDEDGGWTVSTLPDNFHSAIEVLEDAGLEPSSSSVEYLHDMETELSEDSTYDMKVLLHYLEEADEVNEVFHNAKLKEGVELNFTNYGIPIKRKRDRK